MEPIQILLLLLVSLVVSIVLFFRKKEEVSIYDLVGSVFQNITIEVSDGKDVCCISTYGGVYKIGGVKNKVFTNFLKMYDCPCKLKDNVIINVSVKEESSVLAPTRSVITITLHTVESKLEILFVAENMSQKKLLIQKLQIKKWKQTN